MDQENIVDYEISRQNKRAQFLIKKKKMDMKAVKKFDWQDSLCELSGEK